MNRPKRSPFRPGPGLSPPLRVGHDEAVFELEERLESIRDKEGGDIVVLYGPRGNGKTVLLVELQRKAGGKDVLTRELTDGVIAGGPELVAQVLKHGLQEAQRRIKKLGVAALSVKAEAEQEDAPMLSVEQALHSVLKKRPMVLVVDEAHVLPLKFGRRLLQIAQRMVAHDLPLLLALAGTPGLRARLRKMGASFWERSTRLRIGRLETDDAVRQALAVPAEQSGYPIDEDAMELLVKESQRYPFFVQMLGHHSWRAARSRKGASRITLADARAGVIRASKLKADFYLDRYEEVEIQGILDAALAVSKAFLARGESAVLTKRVMSRVLEKATKGTGLAPLEVREQLTHLGFIWSNPDGDWEPGIPSLCAHFVEQGGKP